MKVTKVWTDDWCALYVDGEIVQEGHSIDFYQFMLLLEDKGLIDSYTSKEVHTEDNYPQKLVDLNLE